MYETGLSVSIYLVNSIVGSIYMQKFLRKSIRKRLSCLHGRVCISLSKVWYFIGLTASIRLMTLWECLRI